MNRFAIASTLVIFSLTQQSAAFGSTTAPAAKDTKAENTQDDQERNIRSVLIDLTNAINTGDSDKVSALWSLDAVFVNQTGEEIRGRAAIRERLAKALKQQEGSQLFLHPDKISSPAPNVALVVGDASRKTGPLFLPTTRFSFALVKQNGVWLIDQGTETKIQETLAADHLKELEWLIGDWLVEKPGAEMKLAAQWDSGRNFIRSRLTTVQNGIEQVDNQVIGWDPRSQSIVSWHFDCRGGFGYGKWSKQADGWLVDFAGVGADGSSKQATNSFKVASPDEFTWQSIERIADGTPMPDSKSLTVKRTKP